MHVKATNNFKRKIFLKSEMLFNEILLTFYYQICPEEGGK